MSYQNDDYEIDILGEDWNEFASELGQEVLKKDRKPNKVLRYLVILLIIGIAGAMGVFAAMNSTSTPDKETTITPSQQAEQTAGATDAPPPTVTATPALASGELITLSREWLVNAEQTALTYQAALNATDLDCVAVRTDALYQVPDLPNFETAPREDIAQVGRAIGQMNSANDLLLEAQRRFEQVCVSADSFPNSSWGTFSPLTSVEGALADISTARTTLGDE